MQNQVDYQTIYEAMKNVQDFNFMNYSYNSWFESLKVELFKAFDEVTTIDMRSYDQMELLMDESYVGVVTEKDGRLYPYMCLAIKVKYGYYDANSKKFRISEAGGARFGVKLTPFNCMLDKLGENTGGIYSGADEQLTMKWRHILNSSNSRWEDGFRAYLDKIKGDKLLSIKEMMGVKFKQLNEEKNAMTKKTEDEYTTELEAISIE